MNNGTTREALCDGKAQFSSFALAEKAARRRKKPRRPYRCRYCHQFHVGTTNRRQTTKPTTTTTEEIPQC